MNPEIASERVWGQRPGEDAFEIRIEIGAPYQIGDDPHEWACPVAYRHFTIGFTMLMAGVRFKLFASHLH